jgi:hypothetical protein
MDMGFLVGGRGIAGGPEVNLSTPYGTEVKNE